MTELTWTIHHTTKKKNSHHYTAGIYITHVTLSRAASGCIRKRFVANLLYHDKFGHLNATHKCRRKELEPKCVPQWSRWSFRLQNSRFFFSKSVKKLVKRGVRVSRAFSASFQTFCLTARAYFRIRKNTDCFAINWSLDFISFSKNSLIRTIF